MIMKDKVIEYDGYTMSNFVVNGNILEFDIEPKTKSLEEKTELEEMILTSLKEEKIFLEELI